MLEYMADYTDFHFKAEEKLQEEAEYPALEEHKAKKHDNSRKIWTVYIFLIWYDRFFANGKPVHPSLSK